MTGYAQAIYLNKSKPGAQGQTPETGGRIGNRHDTGMAGAAPAALEQVAQGTLGNQPPAGLAHAINAGQSALGNRNFMQFVGAGQQHGRSPDAHGSAARRIWGAGSPVSDAGNAPVQMMRLNPARRGLPALMNNSALNRDRASQAYPAPGRDLSSSPRQQVWNQDILFGVARPGTLQLAIKQEAATDSAIPLGMFKLVDRRVPHIFPRSNLWDRGAFNFADREQLTRRDVPYMAYVREVIATALGRAGNIYWALGHLHFDNVFSDLFRVMKQYGQDPVRYMAEVSYPRLMDKHGQYIDADTGEEVAEPLLNPLSANTSELKAFEEFHDHVRQGRILDVTPFQPLITTTEITGFLMGDERKYLHKTSFFDVNHQKVDKAGFLSAFYGVLEQLQGRQAELGPGNNYKLEPSAYSPLDRHTHYMCGQCGAAFPATWMLERHWRDFPQHRP